MPTDLNNKLTLALGEVITAASAPGNSFPQLSKALLKIGQEAFQMDLSIVSEVEENNYYVYEVLDNPLGVNQDTAMELGATLCREVFEQRETVFHPELDRETQLHGHPAYKDVGLRSYLGAPIWLKNKLFGTLNFSSLKGRETDFSDNEVNLLKTMAFMLSKQLEVDLHGQIGALIMKNLTHELRSPLNGIIGSTELLSDTELDQEQFELLDLIKRSSQNLEDSVADLSDFIKVTKTLDTLTPKAQYPAQLIKECLGPLMPLFKNSNIHIEHNQDNSVELKVVPVIIKTCIRSILLDCLSRKKDRKEIVIGHRQNDRFNQITIKDNGPLLNTNVLEVLNTFGRIEFSTQSFSASGINLHLSLASILCQLAGGHLRASNIKKEDNEFVLSFPK